MTSQDQLLFRKMVSDLVLWHFPGPLEPREKLVSDIMLHVSELIKTTTTEAYRSGQIGEWDKLLGKDLSMFYPTDEFHDFIKVPSAYINKRLAELTEEKK